MRKCCDSKIQSHYFSDLSVVAMPGIWPSSPVFGPGIPWMFELYSAFLDSVCNLNWPYGQLNSKTSIWNQVSKYGSPESP